MTDTDLLRTLVAKVDALHQELRALRRGDADPRLGAFLEAVFGFSRAEPWSIAELLELSPRDREVRTIVDELTGDAKNRCKSLGRWCARHAGASAGGVMLRQIARNRDGAWSYSVVLCGE